MKNEINKIKDLLKSDDIENIQLAITLYEGNPEYKSKEMDFLINQTKKYLEYLNGNVSYIPWINIVMNDRTKDWTAEIGEYIYENLDGSGDLEILDYYFDRINNEVLNLEKLTNMYRGLGISFLSCILYGDVLKKMFDEPIYTNKYGEELDEEEESEFSYVSYFVEINGFDVHIGYDHRGTGIEIKLPYKSRYTLDEVKKVVGVLKGLVDIYKKEI